MFDLLFLVSSATLPCGVEMFARCLFEAWLEIGAVGELVALSDNGIATAKLRGSDILVLNLPLVAWKKSLFSPLLALFAAKLHGKHTLAVLHEWKDLAWQRRAIFSIYLLLVDMVMFSSPMVAEQFSRRGFRLRSPRNAGILPVPPNLALPSEVAETELSRRIIDRARGRVVIGQFGSIYPKKNSTFVMDVAVELKRRGLKPLVVFAGSFIKGADQIEDEFNEKVRTLGLEQDVIVSGYLETAADVFAVLNRMDALVYDFAEGLTSRRSSVLTSLQSGSPVIVNAPLRSDEFDHHPVFARALSENMLHLVPLKATPADYADAVEAALGSRRQPTDLFSPAWKDAARALAKGLADSLPDRRRKEAVSVSAA